MITRDSSPRFPFDSGNACLIAGGGAGLGAHCFGRDPRSNQGAGDLRDAAMRLFFIRRNKNGRKRSKLEKCEKFKE